MKKRILSFLMAAVMLMTLLPSVVSADDDVAQVGEIGYDTLANAVNAANAVEGGATVELLADVTIGKKLTISGNVTISGEHTITRADDDTGTLFAVNSGATLTLDGGLVIDGGNNYVFNSDLYAEDLANYNTSIPANDSEKWFTPEKGAPVATAFMITTTGGTVNLNKVTIQNNYSISNGVVSAGANSTINLTGAKITHVASTQGNGVAVNASGAGIKVNMNEGTVIDGNHVGGNHGIFKIYSGTVFTMNGGEIKNTTGWNSNGVAIGMYGATVVMNGGTICSNSSVYGFKNGRNAAIYVHSASTFTMNGGTICHNSGRARGGLDAPYADSTESSYAEIKGGSILDNVSISGGATYDVNGGDSLVITGGYYTQDVTEWVAEGYECYLYDPDNGIYIVVPKRGDVNLTVINGEYVNKSIVGEDRTPRSGDIITITTELKEDYYFEGWNVISGDVTIPYENIYDTEFTFIMPTGDVVIEAVFRKIPMPKFTPMVSVTATAGEGGSISYEGRTSVILGMTRTYKITADEGYEIADVTVNGKSVGAVSKYEYKATDMASDKIIATFEKIADDAE